MLQMSDFRLNWSPPLAITPRNIVITPLDHSVKVKMVMRLWHGAKDFLVARQPGKRLLTRHRVHLICKDIRWIIHLMAPGITVILNVEVVNDLLEVEPDVF